MAQFPILQAQLQRFEELERLLADPEVLADTQKQLAFQREYGGLAKVAKSVKEFNRLVEAAEATKKLVDEEKDPEMKALAQAELEEILPQKQTLETELE